MLMSLAGLKILHLQIALKHNLPSCPFLSCSLMQQHLHDTLALAPKQPRAERPLNAEVIGTGRINTLISCQPKPSVLFGSGQIRITFHSATHAHSSGK